MHKEGVRITHPLETLLLHDDRAMDPQKAVVQRFPLTARFDTSCG